MARGSSWGQLSREHIETRPIENYVSSAKIRFDGPLWIAYQQRWLSNHVAGNRVDTAERTENSTVDGFVHVSAFSSVNRVATTGCPGGGIGRSMRTTRARYEILSRYFGPKASQIRKMSSKLRSAGIS